MKTFYLYLVPIILFGCSSIYQAPESIQEKMGRYQSRRQNPNQVPAISAIEHLHSGRSPASTEVKENKQLRKYSNKRLYFLALLSQYHRFQQYLPPANGEEINLCPSFHTSYVEQISAIKILSEAKRKLSLPQLNSTITPQIMAARPYFLLPMDTQMMVPTVGEYLNASQQWNHADTALQQAIVGHAQKTLGEIKELCDSGSSDNYYIYENILASIDSGVEEEKQRIAVVKTLLKSPIFSNRLIISALDRDSRAFSSRSPASAESKKHQFVDEISSRMKAQWVSNFLDKTH